MVPKLLAAFVVSTVIIACAGYPRVVPTYGTGDPKIEADEAAKQKAFQADQRRLHCGELMRSNMDQWTVPPECEGDAGTVAR
jgi:hypothetical protein